MVRSGGSPEPAHEHWYGNVIARNPFDGKTRQFKGGVAEAVK